ncbi:hypothetical protein BHM03_00062758 [Ensete ventricosum]|nr:hypothetical protein BHM03_00062758 [Ensete ventricosum]
MTAPWSRKRVKWLVRLKGPVSHRPAGTTSIAPSSYATLLRLATAAAKAAVFEVTPSPTPPKSVRLATWARHPPTPTAAYWKASSSVSQPPRWWVVVALSGPYERRCYHLPHH